ncbi:MAG: hypothetical protein Q8J62_10430 [Candidatus Cloacimonadaceae bacterium]|nr:hypothetical protein [Candidatus Cloacimonadaceae bacterium]
MPALRTALFEFHTANADIYAGGNPQTCQSFTHPHDPSRHVVVLGNPIIRNGEDFNYPDNTAWSLILSDEERLKSLDGHWVILIIAGDEILAYNDSMCKRTLYIQEDSDRIFWCSELALLKDICKPEIDWESFGAYWHGMFPPTRLYYAPTQKSYFKGVQMLGTGTKAVIAATGITLQRTEWLPSKSIHNLENMLKNMTLLPVRAGKKICVGLTGGMDIRPLIAIYLANGAKLQAVHFGSDKTADFRVARQIASRYKIPFRFIGYEESGVSWEQAKLYIQSRGMGFNPAACDFMGYYPKIAQDSEVYISGYFGELFRFRFMMAHLKTLVLGSHLTYHAIGNYLLRESAEFLHSGNSQTYAPGFLVGVTK